MKALLFFLLLNGLVVLRADDNLLQNGDFSSGLSHWNGDVRTASGVDAGGADLPPGAVIKLRPRDWTRADQQFQVKAGTYTLRVTFTILPDTSFSTDYSYYKDLQPTLNFLNLHHGYNADVGAWVVVVSDPAARDSLCWTIDPTQYSASGQQSHTFTIKDINFDNRQTLTIAFPPGHGLIVLQNVTLVPAGT